MALVQTAPLRVLSDFLRR